MKNKPSWWAKKIANSLTAKQRKQDAITQAKNRELLAKARAHMMANAGLGDITSRTVGTRVLIDDINKSWADASQDPVADIKYGLELMRDKTDG